MRPKLEPLKGKQWTEFPCIGKFYSHGDVHAAVLWLKHHLRYVKATVEDEKIDLNAHIDEAFEDCAAQSEIAARKRRVEDAVKE